MAADAVLNKNFACAGQVIVTPIQTVKQPTTMVKILPFPFDKNELTVKCGILAIKKTVKTLQIWLYSVFLNITIKHI